MSPSAKDVLAWFRAGMPRATEHGEVYEISTGPADPVIDKALRVLAVCEERFPPNLDKLEAALREEQR